MPDQAAALLDALASHPIAGVTCRGKTDGGGAQVQAVMSAQLFAHRAGVPYFHSPLATVAHGSADAAWATAWETYFRLGEGFAAVPEGAPMVTIEQLLDGYDGEPPIVASTAFHSVADADPDAYTALIPGFRERAGFDASPAGHPPVVAVHVRRGDVDPAARRRFTTNEHVARSIASMRAAVPEARVIVYSQGSPDDFTDLPRDVEFALDTDVLETMTGLISADYLVMAKSSFSYVAGLLNDGVVVYEPFWHQPLSSWVHKQADGSIDPDEVRVAARPSKRRFSLFGRAR